MKIIAIGVFGISGIMLRYLIDSYIDNKESLLPYATIFANLIGCFIAGFTVTLINQKFSNSIYLPAIIIGFCGGLTTFSSLILQSIQLVQSGQTIRALFYIVISIALGSAVFITGVKMASLFMNIKDQ